VNLLVLHLMFTCIDFVVSFDFNFNNAPDNLLGSINTYGHIEVIYPDMLEYGQVCKFDIKSAFEIKELGWTIDFCV